MPRAGMMTHHRSPTGHMAGASSPLALPSFAWYGKLPSMGDFVSRRMPYPLQQFWDRWCAAGLESLKAGSLASGWAVWRGSPMWAFLLPEQAEVPLSQLGVFAPSCDRVGRIFPFLVTLPLPSERTASFLPSAASLVLAWAEVVAQAQVSRQGIDELDTALEAALAAVLMNPASAEDSERTLPHGMNPSTLPWSDLPSSFDGQGRESFWWSVPPASSRFRARTHYGALNSQLFLGLCES
jgi:type VI secretion system protein ImpM